MLQAEGLHRYVDPKCLQREILEAADMTSEELDQAARDLIRRSVHETQPPASQFFEHMGGYRADELKDYNQYSDSVGDGGDSGVHHRHSRVSQHQQDSEEDDDHAVHVTTTL